MSSHNCVLLLLQGFPAEREPFLVQRLRCDVQRSGAGRVDRRTQRAPNGRALRLREQVLAGLSRGFLSRGFLLHHMVAPRTSDFRHECFWVLLFSINPEIDVGQIHGAFVMGLGYCFMEKTRYDPTTGKNLTDNTWVLLTCFPSRNIDDDFCAVLQQTMRFVFPFRNTRCRCARTFRKCSTSLCSEMRRTRREFSVQKVREHVL